MRPHKTSTARRTYTKRVINNDGRWSDDRTFFSVRSGSLKYRQAWLGSLEKVDNSEGISSPADSHSNFRGLIVIFCGRTGLRQKENKLCDQNIFTVKFTPPTYFAKKTEKLSKFIILVNTRTVAICLKLFQRHRESHLFSRLFAF